MTDPLFKAAAPPTLPEPTVTERDMLDLLHVRYGSVSMGARRFAVAEHVPSRPGFATRIADFLAIDCYSSGSWDNRIHEIHGFEVKVSRSDWLAELRDPDKAEAFRPYCHRWWLVAGHRHIVRDDLPDGWGLLSKWGGKLRVIHRAPLLEPKPMPLAMIASFARAVAKTATRD